MVGIRAGWRAAWVCGLTVVAFSLLAGTAGATIVERGHYVDPYADSFEFCGLSIRVEGVAQGQFRIRQGTGARASAFFMRDTGSFRETWTNTDNGETLVIRGHQTLNEVKARRVDGDIFQFTTIQAGVPFAIEDSSGHVVVRDRGVIRFVFLFDTLGDDEPGGEFVQDVDVQIHGPHPGFFLDESAFCGVVTDLIG
jgi:hypothetical protein